MDEVKSEWMKVEVVRGMIMLDGCGRSVMREAGEMFVCVDVSVDDNDVVVIVIVVIVVM